MHALNMIKSTRGSVGAINVFSQPASSLRLVPPRGGHPTAVGGVNVQPRYFNRQGVGDVLVQPRYVGDPAYQMVGAPAQMEQGPLSAPVGYSPNQYYAGDVSLFGCGATSIAATSQVTTNVFKPDRPFKPQGLRLPSSVQGLLINRVDIAGLNIFASALGVAIELMSEVSTLNQIDWPTLEPAVGVSFTVTNITGGALNFMPAFYGTQVRN